MVETETSIRPEDLFEELRATLSHSKVTLKRLVTNSLLIYFGCQLGEERGVTIWFEPTWHFCGPQGLLVGSRQAQVWDRPNEEEELERIGKPLDLLIGKGVQSLVLEPRTFDLAVFFEGDYWIKTFAADPEEDHSWHIRDNARRVALYGAPEGLEVHYIEPR